MVSSSFHLLTTFLATLSLTSTNATSTASATKFDMAAKIEQMRAGDLRLVITESKAEMNAIRDDESSVCNSDLPKVIAYLTGDVDVTEEEEEASIYKKGQAAALLALCTHSHPANRAKIGSEPKVVEALVTLVKEAKELWIKGEDVAATFQHLDVAALASEAIWTLAFNSPENHAAFINAGAINELAGFVLASKEQNPGEGACKFANHNDGALGRSPCFFVRMWAIAALEHLSSNYCDNGDGCIDEFCGHCFYEWNEGMTALILEPHLEEKEVKVTVDASAARQTIANMEGLFDELLKIVCEINPMRMHEREHPYPTESQVGRDDGMPSTVGWAAAGVLKNLALEDTVRPRIAAEDAYKCLCNMSGGYDWLETDRAEDAIFWSGRQEECEEMLEERFMGGIDDDYDELYDDDEIESSDDEEESSDDEEAAHGGEL